MHGLQLALIRGASAFESIVELDAANVNKVTEVALVVSLQKPPA